MSWKKDRDSLIAQTMAFVQSVAGRKEDIGRADVQAVPSSVELAVLDALETELVPPPVPKPLAPALKPPAAALEPVRIIPPPLPAAPAARSQLQGEMANEIRARVASFRAHQERFNREREEYFNQTLARLRAAAKDAPPPRITK
jgi:hypothetical protein